MKILVLILIISLLWTTGCSSLNLSDSTPTPMVANSPKSINRIPTNTPEIQTDNNIYTSPDYPAPVLNNPTEAYPAASIPNVTPLPQGKLPEPPKDAPEPDKGKGSISGILFSFTVNMALSETPFYLTSGWGSEKKDPPPYFNGPQTDKGDLLFNSDPQGKVWIRNVPPGSYYLAVQAPYNWAVAVKSPSDPNMLLIEIMADQKLALGVIYLSWP